MIVLALLAAFVGVAAIVICSAIWFAEVITRPKRRRVRGTPADLGLRYDDVQFLAADRTTLRGWFLESPGARATMILVHDAGGTRADPEIGLLDLQRDYVRRGFNVFAFDLRGHGESSGGRDALGSCERLDVRAAVAYVRRRTGELPVLIHGFGLGASLAIAVAEEMSIDGVIADSPFVSSRVHLRERWRRVPAPLFSLGCTVARRLFGADPCALAPIERMATLRRPVLFIHGEADEVVPFTHTLNLTAASLNEHNELWSIPDLREHCAAYRDNPHLYLRRCLDFVEDVVPARMLAAFAG